MPLELKVTGQQRETTDPITRVENVVDSLHLSSVDTASQLAVQRIDSVRKDTTTSITIPGKPHGREGAELSIRSNEWIYGVILLCLILFASVRLIFGKYLSSLLSGLVSYSTASRLYRERGYKILHGSFRLDLLMVLILPAFLFQMAKKYQFSYLGMDSFKLYLTFLLFTLAFFLSKIVAYNLVGAVLGRVQDIKEVLFNMGLFAKGVGMFVLPVVTLIALATFRPENFIYLGIGIVSILYLGALLRGFWVGLKRGVSIFYLILYLCTLEILPLLLIFKLILG